MNDSRVIRTASPVTAFTPTTVTIREVCPCSAAYVSGTTKDPVLWGAWTAVHEGHGFQIRHEEMP